tara:strand:+ start:7869 stop:8075 length:207 start_codon:yes stop_codon:yes gene_type:complete
MLNDRCISIKIMKKFIPLLLFSATTLHTVLGISPVMAMGCNSHSNKADVICDENDTECQEKISTSTIN